jgi:hypothetical protein
MSEELRLYNLVKNLAISNSGLEALSSHASPRLRGSPFGGDDWGFLKAVVKAYLMTPMSPLISPREMLSSHL